MSDVKPVDFRQFFEELHGKRPFPWQESLAEQVCAGGWPQVIDLPTASGKTACVDIALFALAYRPVEMPRRIFFVVDRRVVVNEAYERMKRIAECLHFAADGVLTQVAGALRDVAGGESERPLETYELRGGAYRDESWVKTPLQPTVVASTVDQVGSRLLFRGYGVSQNSWPIHAGLIANDALIFLDEAHCSKAFAQTLKAIERYRGESWAERPIGKPFQFVEMTATPSRTEGVRVFGLTPRDREDEELRTRLYAAKPARLVEVKAKKDDFPKLADKMAALALELAKEAGATRIAVMVNRVRTARLVHGLLQDKGLKTELVMGRMRPLDRDDLSTRLEPLKSGRPRESEQHPTFVVSTQCLEVGADLDFDVLVTECASIDALLQRFGRLDRLGKFKRALGRIVIGSWQVEPKQADAVYGEALSETWRWLKGLGGEIGELDMGIEAAGDQPGTVAQQLKDLAPEHARRLRLLGPDAPVLLPAHLDALVQTSPRPQPEPLLEPFLHGPEFGEPDVQVVWRADLDRVDKQVWGDIVKICPPVSAEAMPVQISVFRRWFSGKDDTDSLQSDLEGVPQEPPETEQDGPRWALAWRGDEYEVVNGGERVKPGDTVVLPFQAGGWDVFGYIPKPVRDRGDEAAFKMRRGVCLRLHPSLISQWPDSPSREMVLNLTQTVEANQSDLLDALAAYKAELRADEVLWPRIFLDEINSLSRRRMNAYEHGETGYVIEGRRGGLKGGKQKEVFLDRHSADVEEAIAKLAGSTLGPELTDSLRVAARFHDYGKADVRFQRWLRGGDGMAAHFAPKPLAKSGLAPVGKPEDSGLPAGFRHELLSILFAENLGDPQKGGDLMLHVIASHHGRCRPFAPVVVDRDAEGVTYSDVSVCAQDRTSRAPHRLDSGVADRFWRLTRCYGWWGLAYVEALFRLGDWTASENAGAEAGE